MARAGCFVLLLVVMVLGYQQYRIQQLQKDVGAISGKVLQPKKSDGKADLVTPLAEAQLHVNKAKELIKNKKDAQAQAELDIALTKLQAANVVSSDIVGTAAGAVGQAKDRAVKVFQDTWNMVSEEAKPKKVDVDK